MTLTNGSTDVADRLFTQAGIRDEFERLMSVEEAGVWKPAADSYGYAARTCGAPLEEMLLVAVHPWDIHGAARAGMRTAWVNRTNASYPAYFRPPTISVATGRARGRARGLGTSRWRAARRKSDGRTGPVLTG